MRQTPSQCCVWAKSYTYCTTKLYAFRKKMHEFVFGCTCTYVKNMCVCVRGYMCVFVPLCMCVHVRVCVWHCMCMWVFVCLSICLFVWTHVHSPIHVYVYDTVGVCFFWSIYLFVWTPIHSPTRVCVWHCLCMCVFPVYLFAWTPVHLPTRVYAWQYNMCVCVFLIFCLSVCLIGHLFNHLHAKYIP